MIEYYSKNILLPMLTKLDVPNETISKLISDVEHRLFSIFEFWHDLDSLRVFIFNGYEESEFWEPKEISTDLKAAICVGVRNSLIEDLHTDSQGKNRSFQPADENWIRSLTENTIRYFADRSIERIAYQANNLFGDFISLYPTTCAAFRNLCQLSGPDKYYKPVKGNIPEIDLSQRSSNCSGTMVFSGVDQNIDPFLQYCLWMISQKRIEVFFAPSLKHLTRNSKKLFEVSEFILGSGGKIVTLNYYISDGYVSKRRQPMKPPHFDSDVAECLSNMQGLQKRHREALLVYKKQLAKKGNENDAAFKM